MVKVCNSCGVTKDFSKFGNLNIVKSGKHGTCRLCKNLETREYFKTIDGLITVAYSHQKQASKLRGHIAPTYSRKELRGWLIAQSNFGVLYSNWRASEYNIDLKPSIDRLIDTMGYSLSNIRLVTWKENNEKGRRAQRKPVLQYTLEGVFIKEFYSVQRVVDILGFKHQSISAACRGNQKTAGGFIWKYKT